MPKGPPTAKLINWTPRPLETMWHLWHFCKEQAFAAPPSLGELYPGSLAKPEEDDIDCRPTPARDEVVDFFKKLIFDFTAIPEFVVFNWAIYNMPRALLAQITRHRLFSFFSQSLRVKDCSKFADLEDYFIPDSIRYASSEHAAGPNYALDKYSSAMRTAQEYYHELVEVYHIPVEDARGVLPLHINTWIVCSTNLRAFTDVVQKRTCHLLQKQYWGPLLASMKIELVTKVDPAFEHIFLPPCTTKGRCQSHNENMLRVEGKDPNKPCPIWEECYRDQASEGQGYSG